MRFPEEKMTALVAEATKWIGVRETPKNRGPEVESFQRAVDGKAQGEPWCMAFVMYCLKAADAAVTGPSFRLFETEHVMTCWNRSPMEMRIQSLDVKPGDLMLWQHYKNGKPTNSGHVGVVVGVQGPGTIETIEGNTSDGSGVVREGDGVFRRVRHVTASGTMRLKGFLRPWGIAAR